MKKEFIDFNSNDWNHFLDEGVQEDKAWNLYKAGEAPEHIKIETLENQVSTLIETTATVGKLLEQLKPIADNTEFVRNVYTKPKPSVKKVSAKESKEEKKLELMNKMISRGRKS